METEQIMSTRAHIGIIYEDNSITAVYNHFDGYPSHLLKNLLKYLDEHSIEELEKEIKRGQKEAGFRDFPETYYDAHKEVSRKDEWVVSDRKGLDEDYAYLFDKETGELKEVYSFGEPKDINGVIKASE